MIVGAIAALVAFIAVGITLIVSDSEDNKNKDEVVIGTTTPTSPTTTLPPATTPTTPATTTATAPPITSGTLTPGTTRVNSPTTTPTAHPSTTKPPVTTTRAPSTTTTTRAKPTVDVGTTDDEIHLAVIADDPQTFQGMSAWMTVVNHHGGIAARKVRLDLLETGGTADGYANAVHTACGQDFAIVGSFSQF